MKRELLFDDGGMNLLSSAALRAIRGALPDDASLFVFRSGRPGLFAAGADMAEMQRFTPWEAYEFAGLGQELFAAIERLPGLTVALIDGDCFGGALDLVLSFDLRFATVTTALGVQGFAENLDAPGAEGGLFDPNTTRSLAGYMFNEFRFDTADAACRTDRAECGEGHGAGSVRQSRCRYLARSAVHPDQRRPGLPAGPARRPGRERDCAICRARAARTGIAVARRA